MAQWPSHRAPSVGSQLHMAAVSMSLLARSRSLCPRSQATQLMAIMAAVSMSLMAMSRLRLPRSVGIEHYMEQGLAAVSPSVPAQWPSHRAPSVGTQLQMRGPMSVSLEAPSAPGYRTSPTSMAQSQLAQHPRRPCRPRRHRRHRRPRRPRRLHPRPRHLHPRPPHRRRLQ